MSQGKPVDQDNRSEPRVVLLAADRSQSIIGEIADGQTNTIGYSAYGEQSVQQKVETQLGFNGQLRERIGWYLLGNGYRAYNPRLMRFHSPDSWSPFRGGDLNSYMYCVGDPVNRSDPTGHNPFIAVYLFARDVASKIVSPKYVHNPAFVESDLGVVTEALRHMQQSVKVEKTQDMSAMSRALSYIAGPKPKIDWAGKNQGGELHASGTWGTHNFPNHASIGIASARSNRPIPVMGNKQTETLLGTQSNSNSKPPAPQIVKMEASLPIYQAQLAKPPPSYDEATRAAKEIRNS